MDSESGWRPLRTVRSWPRAQLAAWNTTIGIALTSATVVLSALGDISTQQSIAMALPATITTVVGMLGRIIPDAWIAWRRGFRRGCEAALTCHTYRLSADLTASALRDIRLAKVPYFPVTRYCGVCGRGFN
jgi:hypothetical protein